MSDLHEAARAGDIETVRAVLAKDPYRIGDRRGDRMTPLHLAAEAGHAEIAGLLLAASASPNVRAYGGSTPLHAAAEKGHAAIVADLLAHGAWAAPFNEAGHTPLHLAAGAGRLEAARLLLEAGADPNAKGDCGGTPLHAAAAAGELDMAGLLLGRGGLANARSTAHAEPFSPWDAAVRAGHEEVAGLLLRHGGSDRAAGALDVHRSAERGYDGRLAWLLDRDPALVSRRDVVGGRTPLHWAAAGGRGSIAELLLARGADPDARDKRGESPADLARASGFDDLAERLKGPGPG
jgi:ankyrin repeat protein